jgi:hypothetical protein
MAASPARSGRRCSPPPARAGLAVAGLVASGAGVAA